MSKARKGTERRLAEGRSGQAVVRQGREQRGSGHHTGPGDTGQRPPCAYSTENCVPPSVILSSLLKKKKKVSS